jgi:hypothetical protein
LVTEIHIVFGKQKRGGTVIRTTQQFVEIQEENEEET